MNRVQKSNLVTSIKKSLEVSGFIIVLHYRGLSDKQLYDFRLSVKSQGSHLKVIKNTLVKVAIEGSDLEVLSPYLSGPVAICYGNDPVSLSKIAVHTSKENNFLKIQIGYLNKLLLSKDSIDKISKLGSLEEVRSSFLGAINAVQSKFIRVLNAPSSGVVNIINNYTSSK
jgi:large subunit ribosomal protein L10